MAQHVCGDCVMSVQYFRLPDCTFPDASVQQGRPFGSRIEKVKACHHVTVDNHSLFLFTLSTLLFHSNVSSEASRGGGGGRELWRADYITGIDVQVGRW